MRSWKEDRRQDVFGRVAEARRLHLEFGSAFGTDRRLGDLLDRYRHAIGRSWQVMREAGVVAGCAACAMNNVGGCCAGGVDEWYDEVLLLVNLLMGCEIPDERLHPEGCLFLGPTGCRLLARHYYCGHFLCPDLKERLGPDLMLQVQTTVGRELHAGWEVERAVLRLLGSG